MSCNEEAGNLVKDFWRKAGRRGAFLALVTVLVAQSFASDARAQWEISPSIRIEMEESSNLLLEEEPRSGMALWAWPRIEIRREGAKAFAELDYRLGLRQLWLESGGGDTSRSLEAHQVRATVALDISPLTSIGATNVYEDFEVYDLPDEDFQLDRLSATLKRQVGARWTTQLRIRGEDLESSGSSVGGDYQDWMGELRVGSRGLARHTFGVSVDYRERDFESWDTKDYEQIRFAVDERQKISPRAEMTLEAAYSQREYAGGADSDEIDGSAGVNWKLSKNTEMEIRYRSVRQDTIFIPEALGFTTTGNALLISLPTDYRELRVNSLNATLRRKISPKTNLILQGAYQRVDGKRTDALVGGESVKEKSVLATFSILRKLSRNATGSVRLAGGERNSRGRSDYEFASLMVSFEIKLGVRR